MNFLALISGPLSIICISLFLYFFFDTIKQASKKRIVTTIGFGVLSFVFTSICLLYCGLVHFLKLIPGPISVACIVFYLYFFFENIKQKSKKNSLLIIVFGVSSFAFTSICLIYNFHPVYI